MDRRRSALDRLTSVHELRLDVDLAELEVMDELRAAGVAWSAIGEALGVTRSAAQQRSVRLSRRTQGDGVSEERRRGR